MCFCCMACSLVVYGFLLLYICLMFLLYLGGHALVVCGMFLLYGMCISCTCFLKLYTLYLCDFSSVLFSVVWCVFIYIVCGMF